MRISSIAVSLSLCASYVVAQATATGQAKFLIFSKTIGYRHASIPDAAKALNAWGPKSKIDFDHTEDSGAFTKSNLERYDGVLFLMTTDDTSNLILNEAQRDAFRWFLDNGGNYVGVHAASVCLQTQQWYKKELGALFAGHPALKPQTFYPTTNASITNMVPKKWTFPEELYRFDSDPRHIGAEVVIAAVDPHDPFRSSHGYPHPIAWRQKKGAGVSKDAALVGRSFYSALGHTKELWEDETYMEYMMASIEWTLGGQTTRALNPNATVGNAAAYPYEGAFAHAIVEETSVTLNVTTEGVANAQTDPEDGNAISGTSKAAGGLPTGEESAANRVGAYAFQAIVPAVLLSAIALGISF